MRWLATGKLHSTRYVYQYRINELNEDWQTFQPNQNLQFLLPTGTYHLELCASRSFQPNAIPLKVFTINIKSPFWKTTWFVTLIIVIMLLLTVLTVRGIWNRKLKKQVAILETERKIQLERERIGRDLHDNLGAYANALLYNTELIESEAEEDKRQDHISDLKFAAKDILTALRETVWALKHESYSAEEIYIRIRNYVQSIKNYFPEVRFQILGNTQPERNVANQDALNIIRIIQEAITNALKHSNASLITIESKILKNRYWQLSVLDNGSGFGLKDQLEIEKGNGLLNMQFRAQQSGFQIDINSDVKGTQIILIIS
jgi:signal transduction histidine kinase